MVRFGEPGAVVGRAYANGHDGRGMLGIASAGFGGIGIGTEIDGRDRLTENPSEGKAGSAGSANAGFGGMGIGIESEGRLIESGNPRLGTFGGDGRAGAGIGGIGMGTAIGGSAGRSHIR
jgi:hypothetical protein